MCVRTVIFGVLVMLMAKRSAGQHYQFSQFYAAPTYLNPAFTGANVCARLTMNHRSQWSGIPGAFTSYQAAFDHNFRKIKSGLGIQLFNDRAGPGSLTTTQFSGLYSYGTRINKRIIGRGGISLGTVQRKVDVDNLIFEDQLENGEIGRSAENISFAGTKYFDVGVGFLVYSKHWWAGFASSHINKPNQTLLNNVSTLPAELKLHAGYKYTIESFESRGNTREHFVTFAANYKKQGKFNQIDLGIYYNKNIFVAGLWYRGIPIYKPVNSYENRDALIVLVGLAVKRFKIGYSYDATVSKLTNANTRGTNEFSITYQFCQPKFKSRRKKNILISCPKF